MWEVVSECVYQAKLARLIEYGLQSVLGLVLPTILTSILVSVLMGLPLIRTIDKILSRLIWRIYCFIDSPIFSIQRSIRLHEMHESREAIERLFQYDSLVLSLIDQVNEKRHREDLFHILSELAPLYNGFMSQKQQEIARLQNRINYLEQDLNKRDRQTEHLSPGALKKPTEADSICRKSLANATLVPVKTSEEYLSQPKPTALTYADAARHSLDKNHGSVLGNQAFTEKLVEVDSVLQTEIEDSWKKLELNLTKAKIKITKLESEKSCLEDRLNQALQSS
jgi:hypothetical protein